MAWVRIHDGAMRHPKILALTDSAFRLWVKGLSYCQLNLTDGIIPKPALRELGAKPKDVTALASSLSPEYAPLWEGHVIGFQVHDFLFWNDSREKVEDRQRRARERLEDWKQKQRTKRVSNSVHNGVDGNGAQTKPNLTKPNLEDRSTDLRSGFEIFWTDYPRKVGREPAWAKWQRLKPDTALQAVILEALTTHRRSPEWLKDDGAYIPHPTTWLSQKRWTDQLGRVVTHAEWVCPHTPHCNGRHECRTLTSLGR